MQVQFHDDGGRLTAQPEGRMEAADADGFAATVAQRLQPGTTGLAIDLDKIDLISLGAIRALLRLARSLNGDGRSLEFLNGGAGVRHALEQAGMADFFPFTPAIHSNRGHHHETT